jgi:hypothetical protein
MSILKKLIQNKVVLDMCPEVRRDGTDTTWRNLDLLTKGDGEWWCSFLGFCDAEQMAEIRAAFDVIEKPVAPAMTRAIQLALDIEIAKVSEGKNK